jgi:hypothetical protein
VPGSHGAGEGNDAFGSEVDESGEEYARDSARIRREIHDAERITAEIERLLDERPGPPLRDAGEPNA